MPRSRSGAGPGRRARRFGLMRGTGGAIHKIKLKSARSTNIVHELMSLLGRSFDGIGDTGFIRHRPGTWSATFAARRPRSHTLPIYFLSPRHCRRAPTSSLSLCAPVLSKLERAVISWAGANGMASSRARLIHRPLHPSCRSPGNSGLISLARFGLSELSIVPNRLMSVTSARYFPMRAL